MCNDWHLNVFFGPLHASAILEKLSIIAFLLRLGVFWPKQNGTNWKVCVKSIQYTLAIEGEGRRDRYATKNTPTLCAKRESSTVKCRPSLDLYPKSFWSAPGLKRMRILLWLPPLLLTYKTQGWHFLIIAVIYMGNGLQRILLEGIF